MVSTECGENKVVSPQIKEPDALNSCKKYGERHESVAPASLEREESHVPMSDMRSAVWSSFTTVVRNS
jgi:hypothetical protein